MLLWPAFIACTPPEPLDVEAPPTAEPAPAPPLRFEAPLRFAVGDRHLLMFPMDGDGIGVSTQDVAKTIVTSTDWTREDDTIRFEAVPDDQFTDGLLYWERFNVELRDADEDGIADSAGGRFRGGFLTFATLYVDMMGPIYDSGFDDLPGNVRLRSTRPPGTSATILPTDALEIVVDEPVRTPGPIPLVVDEEVVLSAAPEAWRSGATVDFAPVKGWWDYGTTVEIGPTSVVDLSGNEMNTVGVAEIAEDPGGLLRDPGFERGGGWALAGAVRVPSFSWDIDPYEGESFLQIGPASAALGYVDVPDDALLLRMQLAYFAHSASTYFPSRTRVTLIDEDRSRRLLWTAIDQPLESAGSTGLGGERMRLDWKEVEIDLGGYAGERVHVLFEVDAFVPGTSSYLFVDDLELVLREPPEEPRLDEP